MATILYLSDLYYKAKGRNYYEEDLYITQKLKDHFDLLLGHPKQVLSFLQCADLIVFRNTGPVMWYRDYFNAFVEQVNEKGIVTFNSFDGKGDIRGKDYLLQLTNEGYPVIPTIERIEDLERLGSTDQYIVKLKYGADSIGMKLLDRDNLLQNPPEGQLIQPFLNFEYEVSFYYLNNEFQYALFAPDKKRRWDLKEYEATAADVTFADKFIKWNNLTRGIARVDACRLENGTLLLVELEDLNPFLSIDVLSEQKREQFIQKFVVALKEAMNSKS